MSPFSFFSSSSTVLSQRIEAFREAELSLLEYAKHRFAPSTAFGGIGSALKHTDVFDLYDDSNHEFEILDTPIHPPSVISHSSNSNCSKGGSNIASCQIYNDEDMYRLHGVKITNKRSSFSDGQSDATSPPLPSKQPAPLVLLHGYANGALYFYRNFMQLSHFHFPTIYALDMLGWGLSSRPTFDLKLLTDENNGVDPNNNNKNGEISQETKNMVLSAEDFFVESLESWRKHHSLPKMTLAGHSMGGYLSVAYAEKYPQHVERLILLSPVGVTEKSPDDEFKYDSLPFYVRAVVKTVRWMFEKGITPGAFLRSLPYSKSKSMVDSYIMNRLPAITCEEERSALSQYLYQNSMLPGSGEYCLSHILTAGAFARVPLVHRIPKLNKRLINENSTDGKNNEMEVHFVYGENDWMDYKGGLEVQKLCSEKRRQWEQQQAQKQKEQGTQQKSQSNNDSSPPPKVFVHGVRNAGHLLMLDNYEEFNAALIIAAGGEGKLPPDFPRPVEFIHRDVALQRSVGGVASAKGTAINRITDEEGAAEFFRGARWNKRFQKDEGSSSSGEDESVGLKEKEGMSEEKKVEEQYA